jgi:predicted HAD superfamily Cof-like phosphohydrolase
MTYQEDVEKFMMAGDQPIQENLTLNGAQQELYMNLITEEYKETLEAFHEKDVIEVADGLADMVWVIMGMCSSCGIDFEKVWNEVKASNMSKFIDGKAIKNEDGKIMKPEAYFRPDIKKVLGL